MQTFRSDQNSIAGTLPPRLDYLGASWLRSYPPWPQGRGRPWFRATGAFPAREPDISVVLDFSGAPSAGRPTQTGR